jgi:hypothetical protein
MKDLKLFVPWECTAAQGAYAKAQPLFLLLQSSTSKLSL